MSQQQTAVFTALRVGFRTLKHHVALHWPRLDADEDIILRTSSSGRPQVNGFWSASIVCMGGGVNEHWKRYEKRVNYLVCMRGGRGGGELENN